MSAPSSLPLRARALLAAIGHTPLVEIDADDGPVHAAGATVAARAMHGEERTRIFAKLESVLPGGSIKDRPVARMLVDAIDQGRFTNGRRLLDSSSGNAGISYAMLGAALGVPVTIVVPGNASRERLDRIAAHGAEIRMTDPIEGYDFALREAQRLAREQPERYWHCNQYANPGNWHAHYDGTGREILAQLGELGIHGADAFVAGIGTGGTLTGVGRRLREAQPGLHVAAVIPELFPGIEGLKPLGHPGDIVPQILDASLIGERIPVTLDDAVAACRRLALRGLYVGPSSGACVHGALQLARRHRFRTVVTVLSDTGERYTSTGMWQRRG